MRRTERLPAFQGIGAGQTATLNIPLGPTVHSFMIRCNADIAATPTDLAAANWDTVFGDIRLKVDGETVIEATADYLVKLAQFNGETLAAGVLPVFLGQPWARTILGEDLTAYGTIGMTSFTMEVEIKSGQTIHELRAYAEQSEPRPWAKHLRIRRISKSYAVIGTDEIADIPRGNHNLLGIDVMDSNVDEIEVLADNVRVMITDAEIRAQMLNTSERVQQTGVTHLDFIPRNRIALVRAGANGNTVDAEAFPMNLQDFRTKLQFTSAPGAYDLYLREIHG